MKKSVVLLTLLLLAPLFETRAQSWGVKLQQFAEGYALGQAMHEGGHFFAARNEGVPFGLSCGPNFRPLVAFELYGDVNKEQVGRIAMGGFGAEIVASELILSTSDLRTSDEYNYFLIGWVAQTIVCPLWYVWKDSATPGGWGDFRQIGNYTHDRNSAKALVAGHAVLNLVRLAFKLKPGTHRFAVTTTPRSATIQFYFNASR